MFVFVTGTQYIKYNICILIQYKKLFLQIFLLQTFKNTLETFLKICLRGIYIYQTINIKRQY